MPKPFSIVTRPAASEDHALLEAPDHQLCNAADWLKNPPGKAHDADELPHPLIHSHARP